jgi:hypothetical protein
MKRSFACSRLWVILLVAILNPQAGRAAPAVFTVLTNQSQLALSGTIVYGTLSAPISAQAAGSLTTSYAGSIDTDIDGSNIVFTGDSVIDARTNGTWQPAPGGAVGTSAAGDYGGKATVAFIVTAYGALREVGLDVTSPILSMTNGTFGSRSLVFSFITNFNGILDYAATTGEAGSALLTGGATNASAANSSLTITGNLQRLVLPIDASYPIGSGDLAGTTLRFTGQIVATRLLPPMITGCTLTNQTAVLTVAYATLQSQLQKSNDLLSWSAASATASNINGLIFFTAPASEPVEFFRVKN